MSRKRIIDSEELYSDFELVEALGDRGLLLYIFLWGFAEDWGGFKPDLNKIALKMGYLRFTPLEVEAYINKLIDLGKIIPYPAGGDGEIYWIKNLMRHQGNADYRPFPKLPLPPWVTFTKGEHPAGRKYATYHLDSKRLEEHINGPTATEKPSELAKCNGKNHDFPSQFPGKERKERKETLVIDEGRSQAGKACVEAGENGQESPSDQRFPLIDRFAKMIGQPYSRDFLVFMQEYPNQKGGYIKAWDVWERKRKQSMLPPLEDLIKAIKTLKRSEGWMKEDGKFIPMVTSFLAQGRWTDAGDLTGTSKPVSQADPSCQYCKGKGLEPNEAGNTMRRCRCRK